MPDWFYHNQMYAVMQPSAAALKGDQKIALRYWNDDRYSRRCRRLFEPHLERPPTSAAISLSHPAPHTLPCSAPTRVPSSRVAASCQR